MQIYQGLEAVGPLCAKLQSHELLIASLPRLKITLRLAVLGCRCGLFLSELQQQSVPAAYGRSSLLQSF